MQLCQFRPSAQNEEKQAQATKDRSSGPQKEGQVLCLLQLLGSLNKKICERKERQRRFCEESPQHITLSQFVGIPSYICNPRHFCCHCTSCSLADWPPKCPFVTNVRGALNQQNKNGHFRTQCFRHPVRIP